MALTSRVNTKPSCGRATGLPCTPNSVLHHSIHRYRCVESGLRRWRCHPVCLSSASKAYTDRQKRPPVFHHLHDSAVKLGQCNIGDYIALNEDESKHACVVLRLKDGDVVELYDGYGTVVSGRLAISGGRQDNEESSKKNKSSRLRRKRNGGGVGVLLETEPKHYEQPHPQWLVAVACGSLKGGRGDWMIEKLAEIGAAGFIPLLTERSPKIDTGGTGGREERWERLSISVMKQSLQPYKMTLYDPCSVQELVSEYVIDQDKTVAFVGVEDAQPLHPFWVSSMPREFGTGLIIIGPEGDFTGEEIQILEDHGTYPVGLGNKRLRTETAAITMLAYMTVAQSL
mmetsp:Transcript_4048/g.8184  ORF Transcript_4048/g.8184 Transcript_4048/m.8184 type:complete len:342 (+) Transcript_4048:70-1095(+)